MLRLAPKKLFCFPNRVFSLGNKIFLVEGKRTCFQLKVGLSTEAASLSCCLASFASSFCFKRYVKMCRERDDAQKPLNCWSDAFGKSDPTSAYGCFGRPKVWYGCSPKLNLLAKWEYENSLETSFGTSFFFSTYAFERTFENEQISSNVSFLVEFHWLGWNSTLLFFEVTKPS